MRELSLHILDITQNSLRAGATIVQLRLVEDYLLDKLVIEISDNGRGMTEEETARALDPFYTTRTTRKVGLGLSMFQANCEATGGELALESQPGIGTKVKAILGLSHIDRPPLGDLPATMLTLIAGSPEVEFSLEHRSREREYRFATQEIRNILGDTPLDQPEILNWLREYLVEQENAISI